LTCFFQADSERGGPVVVAAVVDVAVVAGADTEVLVDVDADAAAFDVVLELLLLPPQPAISAAIARGASSAQAFLIKSSSRFRKGCTVRIYALARVRSWVNPIIWIN
jgi:hypothetical protein